LRTYDRGGMWEYLAIVAQSLALADDRPTRQGRRARRRLALRCRTWPRRRGHATLRRLVSQPMWIGER
jgi:hypothetical protein